MTQIWIESAECLVPRNGTQAARLKNQEQLRKSTPALAAKIESWPWYTNPNGPYGGDEWATFDWEWIGEDGVAKGWKSHLPLHALPFLKHETLGTVNQHAVNGVDDGDWIEYSFYLKASYAFSVLKDAGMIPADSVLMNESDQPLSYDDEELEAA